MRAEEHLRALDLAAVAGQADTDRVERKYLLDAATADRLVHGLAATHAALEIDGRRRFGYDTTYYDSAGLTLFRAHRQGRRRRYKCRARVYSDTGLRTLEVKLKGARGRSVKQRSPFSGPVPETFPPALLRAALEAAGYPLAGPDPLARVLRLQCRRVTLADPETGERLTLDTALTVLGPDAPPRRLRDGLVVAETKATGPLSAADRLLVRLGARPVSRCSKYCLGIALTRPELAANPFLPVLRRGFEAPAR